MGPRCVDAVAVRSGDSVTAGAVLAAVALLMLLAPASVGSSAVPGPAVAPGQPAGKHTGARRVLLVGDSLAVGLARPLALLLAPLTSAAVGGTRIDHWHGPTMARALLVAPSLVVVVLGTNDIAAHMAGNEARPQIRAVVAMARAAGASVAWVGPPSLPWDGFGVRAALAQELSDLGVPLFDSEAAAPVARHSDGVHMTPAGYAEWAAQIAAWIAERGLS